MNDGEFAIATPTFNSIDGEYKISDIKVIGAENIGGAGGEFAQKMNADGTWGQDYYYLTESGAGVAVDGWYKDMFGSESVTDADTLLPGESVVVTAETGFTLKIPSAL